MQQLLSHKHKRHGYINPLRERLSTTYCVSCGIEFHHPARLLKHLKRNRGGTCAKYYMEMEALPREQVLCHEKAFGAIRKSHKALLFPPVARYRVPCETC